MAGNILVNGKKTQCMAKVSSHGKMDGNTKDNMQMIKKMDKVFSRGLMAGHTMVNGLKVSNTVKEFTSQVKASSCEACGQTVNVLAGLTITNEFFRIFEIF